MPNQVIPASLSGQSSLANRRRKKRRKQPRQSDNARDKESTLESNTQQHGNREDCSGTPDQPKRVQSGRRRGGKNKGKPESEPRATQNDSTLSQKPQQQQQQPSGKKNKRGNRNKAKIPPILLTPQTWELLLTKFVSKTVQAGIFEQNDEYDADEVKRLVRSFLPPIPDGVLELVRGDPRNFEWEDWEFKLPFPDPGITRTVEVYPPAQGSKGQKMWLLYNPVKYGYGRHGSPCINPSGGIVECILGGDAAPTESETIRLTVTVSRSIRFCDFPRYFCRRPSDCDELEIRGLTGIYLDEFFNTPNAVTQGWSGEESGEAFFFCKNPLNGEWACILRLDHTPGEESFVAGYSPSLPLQEPEDFVRY